MDLRRNNFDLLRLFFAASVLIWHAYDLSKQPALQGVSRLFSAEFGVKAFFVVSGYLVAMSFENSSTVWQYAAKRLRRVYPAYFTVAVLCAVAGLAGSALPAAEYLSSDVVRYLAANLVFLNFLAPTLPGVFTANPLSEVNGALWTLKIEVMFYAFVPILVWACRRLGTARAGVSIRAFASVYLALMQGSDRPLWAQLQRQLPGQLTFFLAGAALYLYREWAARHWPGLVAGALALYLLQWLVASPMAAAAIEPLWLAITVVYTAYGLPYLGNFARYGDFSYGVYILHFPVIQAVVATGYFARNPWTAFALCAAVTLLLAFLCWHLVEKPFLGRRSHYRLAEKPA
jgi:peptidoglycan/LPS O-acetylase OafA/YrhL